MSTGFIELNDAGIQQAVDGKLIDISPGYAVLDGDRLFIGEAGRRNARLLPRWTNNRFWNQLSTDPIANSTSTIRHHADLAFAHLDQMWNNMNDKIDQVVLAVPGYYKRDQMGLLLGMAKESNIPISGLIDTGLISIAEQPSLQTVMFLDISLHRINITLFKSDGMLRKIETLTVSESGLFTLWDRWANIIAKQFIQTSRYDPMHQAESEQKLFDLLPDWIEKGERANPFDLELEGITYSTKVSGDQLLTACATVYPEIVKTIRGLVPVGDSASLFVSHRFRGFPGLDDSLQLIPNLEINYLEESASTDAAQVHWDKLSSTDGSVAHVTSLPVSARKSSPQVINQSPTHLLVGTRAYGINKTLRIESLGTNTLTESSNNARCTLYQRGQEVFLDSNDPDLLLNGKSAGSQTPLAAGDQNKLGGKTADLITVT